VDASRVVRGCGSRLPRIFFRQKSKDAEYSACTKSATLSSSDMWRCNQHTRRLEHGDLRDRAHFSHRGCGDGGGDH
jgi:hypothetical protein